MLAMQAFFLLSLCCGSAAFMPGGPATTKLKHNLCLDMRLPPGFQYLTPPNDGMNNSSSSSSNVTRIRTESIPKEVRYLFTKGSSSMASSSQGRKGYVMINNVDTFGENFQNIKAKGERIEETGLFDDMGSDDKGSSSQKGEGGSMISFFKRHSGRSRLFGRCPSAASLFRQSSSSRIPGPQVTGVPKTTVAACATISLQLYRAERAESFNLCNATRGIDVETVLFDDHGELKSMLPPFGVFVQGKTMIMAWRGTQALVDWTTNLDLPPVACVKVTPDAKSHKGYDSLARSDMLVTHARRLQDIIKTRGIEEIIFTGHSLGGGVAQAARVLLQGELSHPDSASEWNPGFGNLSLRTVVFSAPMSIWMHNHSDHALGSFVSDVESDSYNFVCGCDPVPHAFGDLKYINSFVKRIAERGGFVRYLKNIFGNAVTKLFQWLEQLPPVQMIEENFILDMVEKIANGLTQETRDTMEKYRHVGKIAYQQSPKEKEFRDKRVVLLKDNEDDDGWPKFRSHYIHIPSGAQNVENQTLHDHSFFIQTYSYADVH